MRYLRAEIEREKNKLNNKYGLILNVDNKNNISIDKAKQQAIDYGHSFKREICFLAVHGFLHLLGYDHMTDDERVVMEKKQEDILNKLQITRD